MSVAGFIDRQSEKVRQQTEQIKQETERLRQEQFEKGLAEVNANWSAWNERRLQAEARGEPFDEPWPGSEEAEEVRGEAVESTFLYRLQRHWVWPHIVILFLACLVIDMVALGYGVEWLVKYVAGIEGSGTVFRITMGSLLLIGAYWLSFKLVRRWYGAMEALLVFGAYWLLYKVIRR